MLFPLYDENPTRRPAAVTITIIVINFFALIYTQHIGRTQGPLAQSAFITVHGFVPARLGQLVDQKPLEINIAPKQIRQFRGRRFLVQGQKWLVLQPSVTGTLIAMLTCMFLHGGWFHLLSNMWFFWIFGNNIEDRLGHGPFLLFYLGGGVIATISHALMIGGDATLSPVVGASGAVAVTLGATRFSTRGRMSNACCSSLCSSPGWMSPPCSCWASGS